MVHWGWLVPANMAGLAVGVFVMAIISAGAFCDAELKHFREIQQLKGEIERLKIKPSETSAVDE
jgi:hypothetical protein